MDAEQFTVYELCDEGGGVHYVGKTRHPDRRRRQHEKAWPQWSMRVVSQVEAGQAKDVETRLIKEREAAGHVLENVAGTQRTRAKPVRKPENKFVRLAKRVLAEVYGVPQDHLLLRRGPFGHPALWALLGDETTLIYSPHDLAEAVDYLRGHRAKPPMGARYYPAPPQQPQQPQQPPAARGTVPAPQQEEQP